MQFLRLRRRVRGEALRRVFQASRNGVARGVPENIPTDIVEVRFKNTRRSVYLNADNLQLKRGDIVAVEASPGRDIGVVSLTGDLVARQMRRTGFNPYNGEFKKVYRKAKTLRHREMAGGHRPRT